MDAQGPVDFDQNFIADLERLFRLRRDVRRFRTDPIPEPLLEETLKTLEYAPSVGLSQPWRLVFFNSAKARAAARAAFEAANAEALAAQATEDSARYAGLKLQGMDAAPVQFALFVDQEPAQGRGLGRRTMPEAAHYSAVCAVMQLWLAARARGLGLGWVSIIDPDAIHTAASADAAWRLIGYFCLGFPIDPSAAAPELERAGWERRANASLWRSVV